MSGALPTTPTVSETRLKHRFKTLVSRAQSGRDQARKFGGHRWELTAVYPEMVRIEFAPIRAFLASQEGQYDTFTYAPPDMANPLGSLGGSPVVSGASQTGKTLDISGLTAGVTDWGKADDIFTIAGDTKVYQLTTDVDSDGSGLATLTFVPELVASPSNGAALTFTDVAFTVRAARDEHEFRRSGSVYSSFEVDMIESL